MLATGVAGCGAGAEIAAGAGVGVGTITGVGTTCGEMGPWGGIGDGAGLSATVLGRELARGGSGEVAGRGGGICTGAVNGLTGPPCATGAVPAAGSGEVGERVAARRCICEVMAREIAADAELTCRTGGTAALVELVGSVVRCNFAVCGRVPVIGGASEAGFALAADRASPVGGGGALGGGRREPEAVRGRTEREAEGPSVRRI